MTNDNTETLGDALGPGVTKDDLADTERVLQRFDAVADDEFEDCPQWLRTAHRAVCRALEHYNSELGEAADTDSETVVVIDNEALDRMQNGAVATASIQGDPAETVLVKASEDEGLPWLKSKVSKHELGQEDSTVTTPPNLNDAQWVREGLLDHPPDNPGEYTSSGAYALRKAHSADELVMYRAIDVIQTND